MTGDPIQTPVVREAKRRAVRASFAARALLVLGLALTIVVVGLQLVTTVQTNRIVHDTVDYQAQARKRGLVVVETAERIESCTRPGGACYERQQAKNVEAVGGLTRVVVAAAVCARQDGIETIDEIEKCVKDTLKLRDRRRRGP